MKKIKNLLKGSPVAMVVAGILIAGVATAAVLTYYGVIKGTAEVWQSVLVNGKGIKTGSLEITYDIGSSPAIAGNTYASLNTLENRADVPAKVKFVTTQCVAGSGVCVSDPGHKEEGITTTYLMGTEGINFDDEFLHMSFDVKEDPETFLLTFIDTKLGGVPGGDFDGADYMIVDPEVGKWDFWYLGKWQTAEERVSGGAPEDIAPGWSEASKPDDPWWEWNCESFEATESRTDGVTHYEFKIPLECIEFDAGYGLSLLQQTDAGFGNWSDALMKIPGGRITLQPGETKGFAIVNEFAINLKPDTYTIITNVVPVQ